MPPRSLMLLAEQAIDGQGRVISGGVSLEIRDGKIVDLQPNTGVSRDVDETVDLGPSTLLPGLVDAHMHFFGVGTDRLGAMPFDSHADRALRAAGEAGKVLRRGITSVRCLGSAVGIAIARAIELGYISGPRVIPAGEYVCSTGGTWDHLSLPFEALRSMDMIADGPDELRAIVRRRARSGARVLKLGVSKGRLGDENHPWGADPRHQLAAYSTDELRIAVSTARDEGMRVAAHCIGDEPIRRALEAGIDTLEHAFGMSDETRRKVADSQTVVVTTFSLMRSLRRASTDDEERLVYQRHSDAQRREFEKGLKAGIRYALGSDLTGPPATPQEEAAEEVETAVEWGMEPAAAIQAATRVSAEAIGLGHLVGSLTPGMAADVIAVPGDPLQRIEQVRKVSFVMKAGEIVYRASAGRPSIGGSPGSPTQQRGAGA